VSGCVVLCLPSPGAVVAWFVTGSKTSLRKCKMAVSRQAKARHHHGAMTGEPGAVTRIWLGYRARLDAGTLGVVAGDRHQRGAGDRAALQGVGQLVVCHLVWPRRGRGGLPGGPARSGICWRARPGYSGAGVPLQNLYAASSDQSCGNHLAGAKAGDRTAWRQPCCPSTSGARLPSRRALAPIPCPGSGPACRSGAAQCRPAARAARCWWRPR